MFITTLLCKPFKFPKGNIWRGKYRLVRKVTKIDLSQVRRELDTERRNMFYLRNPFLKAKEILSLEPKDRGIDKPGFLKLAEEKHEKFLKIQEHRKLDVYLKNSLNRDDKWE